MKKTHRLFIVLPILSFAMAACSLGKSNPVKEVKITTYTEQLKVDERYQFKAELKPYNVSTKIASWVVEGSEYLSVSKGGLVQGLKIGQGTVIAYADKNSNGKFDQGEVNAKVNVKVVDKNYVPTPTPSLEPVTPTPVVEPTPTPTPSKVEPTPTEIPTPSPSISPTPTLEPTPIPTPTEVPTPTLEPTIIPSPTENPNPTEIPTPTSTPVSDVRTYYFTNIEGWNDVYVYAYKQIDEEHSNEKTAWPGELATYVETNGYGQSIYSYEIDVTLYQILIFNNGLNGEEQRQTSHINLETYESGTGFYISNNELGYGSYVYEPYVEPTPTPITYDLRIFYFSNNQSWENVYVYAYKQIDEEHSNEKAAWPGELATFVEINGYNETIFCFEINVKEYSTLIFNNGLSGEEQRQSPNISISGLESGTGFYLDDSEKGYSSYVYAPYITPTPTQNESTLTIRGSVNSLALSEDWSNGKEVNYNYEKGEYQLLGLYLTKADEFKFVYGDDQWMGYAQLGNDDCKALFAEADNLIVNNPGTYNFYIKPEANEIWVTMNENKPTPTPTGLENSVYTFQFDCSALATWTPAPVDYSIHAWGSNGVAHTLYDEAERMTHVKDNQYSFSLEYDGLLVGIILYFKQGTNWKFSVDMNTTFVSGETYEIIPEPNNWVQSGDNWYMNVSLININDLPTPTPLEDIPLYIRGTLASLELNLDWSKGIEAGTYNKDLEAYELKNIEIKTTDEFKFVYQDGWYGYSSLSNSSKALFLDNTDQGNLIIKNEGIYDIAFKVSSKLIEVNKQ